MNYIITFSLKILFKIFSNIIFIKIIDCFLKPIGGFNRIKNDFTHLIRQYEDEIKNYETKIIIYTDLCGVVKTRNSINIIVKNDTNKNVFIKEFLIRNSFFKKWEKMWLSDIFNDDKNINKYYNNKEHVYIFDSKTDTILYFTSENINFQKIKLKCVFASGNEKNIKIKKHEGPMVTIRNISANITMK